MAEPSRRSSSSVWGRPGAVPVGAEYETGTVTLALVDCAALGITFRPNCVPIAVRVEDVAAARAELERRGVRFLGATMDTGVCHKAHLRDPAGNVIELHHRYAPRA